MLEHKAKPYKSVEATRKELLSLLGISLPQGDGNFEILERVAHSNHHQYSIVYRGFEKDIISAYLLVPLGEGPFPAVVVHHQHNSEWHLGKSEVCGFAGDPLNAFAPALVEKGYVVLASDSVGFEDRRRTQKGTQQHESDWLQYFNGMAYRLVEGQLLLTTVLSDALIASSILKAHPKVMNDQIGVLGHSYGGTLALFQAALDPNVSFACSSGAACSYRFKMGMETGFEMSLLIPGILKTMDLHDVLKCIAPKKLLLLSANQDKYSMDAPAILNQARNELTALLKKEQMEHRRFKGGHALTQERFDGLMQWFETLKTK